MFKTTLTAAALAAVTALSTLPAQAGGSVSLSIHGHGSHRSQAIVGGLVLYHLLQGDRARVRQYGSGHAAAIAQSGGGNSALIHQEGRGHSASINQQGYGNRYGVFQYGRNTNAHVGQYGRGQSGVIVQYGW